MRREWNNESCNNLETHYKEDPERDGLMKSKKI